MKRDLNNPLVKMDFHIEWHNRLGSTNACMRERLRHGAGLPDGHVIAAREQTAGRGRQNRKWLSTPDTNLCFSLFVETDADLVQTPSLTMAAALAVTDLLAGQRISAAPKWPNDVLVGNKKICGILSERIDGGALRRPGIVVGIGLNVNMSGEEAGMIDRPATSMMLESGKAYGMDETLAALLPHLDYWIGEWKQGGFPRLRSSWTEKAGPLGKRLSVHDGDIHKSGRLAGFGEHGELLLETANGIETIWSGDVA